jgi:hypothetical protein
VINPHKTPEALIVCQASWPGIRVIQQRTARRPGQHVPVNTVTLGREDDGLRFSGVERGHDGSIWYVRVRLRTDGLDASLRVSAHYATGFDELVEFLRGLAAHWRGWAGERTYESMERELRLTATHDGHVRLVASLRQSSVPDGWSASAKIRIDPGEELTTAAEDIAALLSPPRSSRQA